MKRYSKFISEYSFKDRLAMLMAASLFLPYFLCAVMLIICVVYAIVKFRGIVFNKQSALLFAVPLVGAAGALRSGNIIGLFGTAAVFAVFVFALFLKEITTEKLYYSIVKIIAAGSCASFGMGVLQMIYFRSGLAASWGYPSVNMLYNPEYFQTLINAYPVYRSVSTFFNANYYAAAASIALLISVYMILKNGLKERLYIISAVCNIGSILLSGSRTALLASAASCFLMFILMRRRMLVWLSIAAAFLAGGLFVLFPSYMLRIDSLVSTTEKRTAILEKALSLIPESPVIGQGFFAYYHNNSGDANAFSFAYHSHNFFIEMLLCFGILGVLLMAAYIISEVIRIKKCRAKRPESAVISAVICYAVISGFGDCVFTGLETSVMFAAAVSSLGLYKSGCNKINNM